MNILKFLFRLLSLFTIFNFVNSTYNLVWQDEFNGNSLDTSKWGFQNICDGAGNNELECYTSRTSNVYVTGGNLNIKALIENYGGKPFTSGRISTGGKASWVYGSFQARAKIPNGLYLWPAIWMMPADNIYGNVWASSGEIDIMENRGGQNYEHSCALHFGGSWPKNIYEGNRVTEKFDLTQDFHIYGVNWTSTKMDFFIDNTVFYTMPLTRSFNNAAAGSYPYTKNGSPFDQKFHWILNVATGGDFFGANSQSLNADIARGWANPVMQVDWVRVYQDDGKSPSPLPSPTPAQTPYDNNCGDGYLSCNGQCYLASSCCVNGSPVTIPKCSTSSNDNNNNVNNNNGNNNNPQPTQGSCPPGLMSCNGQCYNPSQNDCVLSSNNQLILCPKGMLGCDKACYSPNNYKCVNNQLQSK